MTEQKTPDRIVLISKAAGRQFERNFFLDIQEAVLNGYRIAETDLRDDESMRLFRGRLGRAVLYKEGKSPEKWTPAVVSSEAALVKDEAPIVKEEVKEEELSTGKAENEPVKEEEAPKKATRKRTTTKKAK